MLLKSKEQFNRTVHKLLTL